MVSSSGRDFLSQDKVSFLQHDAIDTISPYQLRTSRKEREDGHRSYYISSLVKASNEEPSEDKRAPQPVCPYSIECGQIPTHIRDMA